MMIYLLKKKNLISRSDVDKTQSLSPNKIEKVEEYEKEHTKSDKNNKKEQRSTPKMRTYEHSEKKKKSTKSKRKHSSSPETNIDEDKDKNDLEENLNYSKEKKTKDSKSKRKESISEEANIDELQKMKEQLQRELDLEREEEERVSSTTQSKDSDKRKRYKKTKDEEETRQNHGKRKLESEDGAEDESTIQKAKQIKTSDTYWNKYADKLGIQIDDPKFEKRNRETEKSQKDGERKVKETKIDSLSLNKAPSGNELIKKPVLDPLSTRAGGAYIPPAKLKMMQEQITDKSSQAFQRLSWEALKKSINGLVNKINVSNIKILVRELFKENIIRGRGVLCRSLMQAQAFSPTFTHVYAALVAVINSKFPQIGELLLHRLVLQFRRGVKRNDKNSCMASCKFLAHLINQQVAHEVVALEILTMLLEKAKDIMDETPTGEKSRQSSVELSITFLKDCGMKLSELTPKGLMIIMETLRNILHEGKLDARYKYMIEVLMAIQKENFKDFPSVVDDLDLVEEGEQFTHVIELDGKLTTDDILNVFKLDPNYEENEKKYQDLKASILGESDDDDGDDDSGTEGDTEDSDSKDEESDNEEKKDEEGKPILDRTESNLIAFRRTVYLTIQSSLDVDECAHKLLKGEIKPGWEEELCNMIIDCCAQQRTYIKFYGLLAQRFCMINKIYQEPFENLFKDAFETCHRLEIEKLRNVAKLFAHLFFSDAISWEVMSCIHLNQDETTSSSRVFLKILFEELANFMGLCKLNERLREPTLSHAFDGLLPRDNPVNTRFAINFFTTIGLGGLTDDLREFLRSQDPARKNNIS
ncbi:Pre-mRNA-splicing factor CWC22-like protein [Armadillidium vulgare]|nr:Pre-mRNA-splicing factor CWC22-like protein [Armadillidium vulgare]